MIIINYLNHECDGVLDDEDNGYMLMNLMIVCIKLVLSEHDENLEDECNNHLHILLMIILFKNMKTIFTI